MSRARWLLPSVLLVGSPAAGAAAPTSAAPRDVGHEIVGPRRATSQIFVYWNPRRSWPRRARVEQGAVLQVGETVQGSGCAAGWGRVEGGGFVCLSDTEPSPAPARMLPTVEHDHVLPFLYAHDPKAPAFNYAYVGLGRDDDGREVLVRPDGERVPARGLELHVPSRFSGRDLEAHPAPAGTYLAWAVDEATAVFAAPEAEAEVVHELPRYAPLALRASAEGDQGHWYSVVEGLPEGIAGYVDDRQGVHHFISADPPDGVGPDELWIDVELSQQVLALRRGVGLLYVTLVAGGLPERPTPTGLFRIRSKRAHSTMRNLASSPDRYVVEEVPWAMYFFPHYALHGAYWHDEFGRPRSHGCVNLAPLDAAYLYERVSPRSAPGFARVYSSRYDRGTTVRIRDARDDAPLRDRR